MIDDPDRRHLLAIAQQATAQASELVRSKSPHVLTSKGDRDLTSDVDIAVEQFVRNFLHRHTPGVGFLGEESGGTDRTEGLRWVLDPVDGTINLIHGLPLCAVSLSLLKDDSAIVGVIDMPFLGTQYHALINHGSYVKNQRLHVSTTHALNTALVSIDQYTFSTGSEYKNVIRRRLVEHLASHVQRVRMLGASSIDLAWTAHGRLDACIMLGNKPWDTSAGVLIAREAGARVLDLHGANHTMDSSSTIAVTPTLEHELMAAVGGAIADSAITE